MPFDQPTRNRLQKFVGEARALLTEEFTRQLQQDYGLNPATGEVSDLAKLTQLDDSRRQTARLLRETLEHYLATSPGSDRQATIERIVREQAFTVLNRLCALRMAEARLLLIESIGQGHRSKGFQLYARLAGTALGETGDAYRCYLFSLFDEFAVDLAVLFDRFSPSGKLFPREAALLPLLDQLNHPDLETLWAEDETIGWIYQYFNDPAERKSMRDVKKSGSAAPRNSRELAVRNQFFTPRYVVEFLADNTLGRIWYEMTQGQTALKDSCRYLIRRPDEVFLGAQTEPNGDSESDGPIQMAQLLQSGTPETWPEFHAGKDSIQDMVDLAHCVSAYVRHPLPAERFVELQHNVLEPMEYAGVSTQDLLDALFLVCRADRQGGDGSVYATSWFVAACNEVHRRALESRRTDLSQDRLLNQPVFIPFRPLKDPREIRMIDPACGSMHFGLYAFDLFSVIYDEAWDIAHSPADAAKSAISFAPFVAFAVTFPDKAAFLREVPRLIVERNIHGIDIDPRATQIAGLSLWLRAQKAWHAAGVKPVERPRITRSNIVCAEPMPGEKELLREFIERQFSAHERPAFTFLLERIFDRMSLAGEAGSLLRIEEEIREVVVEAQHLALDQGKLKQRSMFPDDDQMSQRTLDLRRVNDEEFWRQAEQRIYDALEAYSRQVENGGFQRRLFADDAAQGFAFIDLCRKRYDVVVMNPPFGEAAKLSKRYIEENYEHSAADILHAFVERGLACLNRNGREGVISARTGFFLGNSKDWRKNVIFQNRLVCFADLGLGVLDDALVEVAAYAIQRGNPEGNYALTNRQLDTRGKERGLLNAIQITINGHVGGLGVFDQTLLNIIPDHTFAYWSPSGLLRRYAEPGHFGEAVGRVRQGIATADDFRFARLSWEVGSTRIGRGKRWQRFSKGGEYSPVYDDVHLLLDWMDDGAQIAASPSSRFQNIDWMFKPGACYPARTASAFAPKALPSECIFSHMSQSWFSADLDLTLLSIGFLCCRAPQTFLELAVGSGDIATAGSAARRYTSAVVECVPAGMLRTVNTAENVNAIRELYLFRLGELALDESSCHFCRFHSTRGRRSLRDAADAAGHASISASVRALEGSGLLDRQVTKAFSLSKEESDFVNQEVGVHPTTYSGSTTVAEAIRLVNLGEAELMAEAVARHGSKRWFTKKSYFVDRRLEVICHVLGVPPVTLESLLAEQPLTLGIEDATKSALSESLGYVLGRWDIRYGTGDQLVPELPAPFAPLPACPPGMLQGGDGLPLSPEAGRQLRADGKYPIDVAWDGLLVDDPEHPLDIERQVRTVFTVLWGDRAEALEHEACEIFGVKTLRDYFRKPALFFADHLKRYSKSRRQAPIYWPLSSSSGTYTVWIYYHRLTNETLYSAVNDFVDPKLGHVSGEVARLRQKSGRSGADEKELEKLASLELEVKDFRDELLRIARFWKPNLNDGVQITAAPLWKLFRLPIWQKKLKQTWQELEAGDYDWAHLAYSIWPDRVTEKCKTDKSLAIAHKLEHLYVEVAKPKKRASRRKVVEEDELENG